MARRLLRITDYKIILDDLQNGCNKHYSLSKLTNKITLSNLHKKGEKQIDGGLDMPAKTTFREEKIDLIYSTFFLKKNMTNYHISASNKVITSLMVEMQIFASRLSVLPSFHMPVALVYDQ
jgi:hypothetical protein